MFQRSLGGLPSASPRTAAARTRQLQLEQLEQRQLLTGQVIVDPSFPMGTISPQLIGTNVIYSRESDALWADGSVAASLKALHTGFMRYPGGEVTSFYHWNHGTGVPFEDSWEERVPVQPASQWMNFDEYMRQVKLAGATPLVGINIQSGHNTGHVAAGVAEAVALVRYAQSKGYGVEHYFIDNEQYAANADMSATQYANYVNLYATAMRKVDPNLKIVVNWQSLVNDGWKTILKIAGPNIDYVDFHAYWNRDAASFANWRGQRLMEHAGETYFAKIQDFRQELVRQGLDAKIAAFEWNLGPARWWARPSPFQAALMNSEAFMQFVWARLDAAAFWPLHSDANAPQAEDDRSLLTAGDLEQSAIYQMLSMYKELLGKELVAVKFAGSGVLATAGYQPKTDTTTVMLLEKMGRGEDLRIALRDFLKQPGSYQVQAQTFRAPDGDLQADRGEIVSIPYTIDRKNGAIRIAVGPYTLTKVTIRHLPEVTPPKLPTPLPAVPTPPVVSGPATDGSGTTGVVPPKIHGGTPPIAVPPPSPPGVVGLDPVVMPVIESPSAGVLEPVVEAPSAGPTVAPSQPTPSPSALQPQTVLLPGSDVAASQPHLVDHVFDSLGTESGRIAIGAEALSLRALLAVIPEEIVTERKRRGRVAFLTNWPADGNT